MNFFKYLIAEGSSSSNWCARVKREWKKSGERLLRTIFFYSGHLQHESERPSMERKHMSSGKVKWKKSELITLISEVGGGRNTQSKQAHVQQYKW